MSVFVFIIIIVALVMFGEVTSKWLASREPRPAVEPGRDEEIEGLREHVALLAGQVERLTEEQRFMTRLLESGGRGSGAPPDAPRPEGRPDSRRRGPNRC